MSEMAFRGGEFDLDFDPGSGRNSASGVHMASFGLRNGYVSVREDIFLCSFCHRLAESVTCV